MQTRSFSDDVNALLNAAADDLRVRWLASEAFSGEGGRTAAASVVRFGVDLGMNFPDVTVLLLKSEWERTLAQLPQGGVVVETRLLKKRFTPDSAVLFAALRTAAYVPNGMVFDETSLHDLLQEMVALELHVASLDSGETRAFIERRRATSEMLRGQPADAVAELANAKREWLMLLEELGERLLYLERRRLEQENVEQRWLAEFGAEYVALVEQTARVARLQRLIDLKLSAPALTRPEAERMADEGDDRHAAQARRLRFRLSIAGGRAERAESVAISSEELGAYRRQCKRVLREIWLLIHPDKLAQNTRYAALTDSQKELLREFWSRAMSVRAEELGFEAGDLGYEYRSLTVLEDILSSIHDVLANAGIDTDVSLIMKGDTPGEQLEWLRGAIQRVRSELDHAHAELIQMLNDGETQQRLALLAAGAQQRSQFTEATRSETRKLDERAARMDEYLSRLFSGEERPP
jgi:hypothetical protein